LSHHLQISLLGYEIAREGLKQLMGDRGFKVSTWPLNQLKLCIARLPDASNQLVVVDAADSESGIAICRSIREKLTEVRILLLHDDDVRESWDAAAGVDYAVARSAKLHTLWRVLDRIARKTSPCYTVFEPDIQVDERAELRRLLSMREIEILFCLARGQTNKLIARRLDISEATVKVHVKTMLRKLSLANRTQAAIWALQHHLISFDDDPAWVMPPGARLSS
jgi:two-component system nitrate/nitrite response regulator NarL